jgi:hypothetical protein
MLKDFSYPEEILCGDFCTTSELVFVYLSEVLANLVFFLICFLSFKGDSSSLFEAA